MQKSTIISIKLLVKIENEQIEKTIEWKRECETIFRRQTKLWIGSKMEKEKHWKRDRENLTEFSYNFVSLDLNLSLYLNYKWW